MNQYKEKTEGSFIEEKDSCIIWNFSNTEFEYGQMQARELKHQILNIFEHLPIDIIETRCTIQVVPKELKKEKLVRNIFERGTENKPLIDFIFYIGDDLQTEQLFRYLNRIQKKQHMA